jgi:hypothetical protein
MCPCAVCVTRPGGPSNRGPGLPWTLADASGAALVAALATVSLLMALGLGLLLTTSLEPLAVANHESAVVARLGAESAIFVAAHELDTRADWDAVLNGSQGSGLLEIATGPLALPDGSVTTVASLTNLAMCDHSDPCSAAEASAATTGRPWGANNPRWQPFGVMKRAGGSDGPPPVLAVVWVGDDVAELDGNPLHDTRPGPGGTFGPGACTVMVRAEAFTSRAGHAAVAAVLRRWGSGCTGPTRIVAWRDWGQPGNGAKLEPRSRRYDDEQQECA